MSIYTELARIQKSLSVPKLQKNNFGNYNYRSCEDILAAFKKIETDGVLILNDEVINIGNRIYIKATANFHFMDSVISVCGIAREEESKKGMDASQVTGAASSYARKYALNGLFAIDDTKDSDATNDHGKNYNKKEVEKQIKSISDMQTLEAYYRKERLEAEKSNQVQWLNSIVMNHKKILESENGDPMD